VTVDNVVGLVLAVAVVLSRTTLFPAGLADPRLGEDWLNDQ
jgi:hypothetical protein